MAVPNQHAKIVGEAILDISLSNKTHSGMIVELIKDIFINIVIGKDILKMYNKMIIKFNGPGDKLNIGTVTNNNHFRSIYVSSSQLYSHVSINITLIITKLHHHTISDNKFIREETA